MSFNYNDNFEEVMMRYHSLNRRNRDLDAIASEWDTHAVTAASRCFYKFSVAFGMAGYELDDVTSLARVQLLNFVGNFSAVHNEGRREKAWEKLRVKSEDSLIKKDLADLHLFLKQRLEDAARLLILKSQNYYTSEFKKLYFKGPINPLVSDEDFLSLADSLGFKQILQKEYLALKKTAKAKNKKSFQTIDGEHIRMVSIMPTIHTITQNIDNDDSIIEFNSTEPVIEIETLEKNDELNRNMDWFMELAPNEKEGILNTFLSKYSRNPKMRSEVCQAKKMLRSIGS